MTLWICTLTNRDKLTPMPQNHPAQAAKNQASAILQSASRFYSRHQSAPEVRRTFGYFTRHPVAPLNRQRLELLLDEINTERQIQGGNQPLRILDLACGGGLITCALARQGNRTLGVDLDPAEIRMAQLFAGEERLDGVFMRADLIQEPDWESRVEQTLGGKPHAVTMAYALHHLPQVEEFTQRLGRWLPSGAALIVNEENPEAPLFRLKHRVRTVLQHDTETEWHRSFSGWKALLDAAGFEIARGPRGLDFIPALGRLAPLRCWSLVFAARKR